MPLTAEQIEKVLAAHAQWEWLRDMKIQCDCGKIMQVGKMTFDAAANYRAHVARELLAAWERRSEK